MKRRSAAILAALVLTQASGARAADCGALTLPCALELARGHARSATVARRRVDVAHQELDQLRVAGLPSLQGTLSAGAFGSHGVYFSDGIYAGGDGASEWGSAGLELLVPLLDGGARRAAEKAGELAEAAAVADADGVILDVQAAVAGLYLQITSLEGKQRLLLETEHTYDWAIAIANDLSTARVRPVGDLLTLSTAADAVLSDAARTSSAIVTAKTRLGGLLTCDCLGAAFVPSAPAIASSVDCISAASSERLPEVRSAALVRDGARATERATSLQRWPSVAGHFTGDVSMMMANGASAPSSQGWATHGSAMLVATVPIWEPKVSSAIGVAHARTSLAEAGLQEVEADAASRRDVACAALNGVSAALAVAQNTAKTADEGLRVQRERFSAGLVLPVELVTAMSALQQARAAVQSLELERSLAVVTLARALGRRPDGDARCYSDIANRERSREEPAAPNVVKANDPQNAGGYTSGDNHEQ